MDITIQPAKLHGSITVIPSKSQAHRYLICAALSDNETELICPETNRDIEATVDCLNALGANVEETPDGLIVHGKTPLTGGTVDSFNDHRIAMSMAIAACVSSGPVTITNAGAVAKSYPSFFEDYCMLGGEAASQE